MLESDLVLGVLWLMILEVNCPIMPNDQRKKIKNLERGIRLKWGLLLSVEVEFP